MEYSLFRIFSIWPQKKNKSNFKIKTFYHYNDLELQISDLSSTSQLYVCYSDSFDDISLISTLCLFRNMAFKNQTLNVIQFEFAMSVQEILRLLYINLFHELGYITKDKMNMGVMGQALSEIENPEYVEEILLFFETFRWGVVNMTEFLPPITLFEDSKKLLREYKLNSSGIFNSKIQG